MTNNNDHVHGEAAGLAASPAVLAAAHWLADQHPPIDRPIPELQSRFRLSLKDSCSACTLAGRMRMLRRAFG